MQQNLLDKKLIDFLNEMTDPRKDALIEIYNDYKNLFHYAKGSSHNHQAWEGGYADHIIETLRVNEAVYNALSSIRPLEFSQDNATIALFFHDIEKPFRYGPDDNEECISWRSKFSDPASWEKAKWLILDDMKKKYHLSFTKDELNAIKYTHSEGADHKKDERVSTPLAAHVHHCDNTSARIWPNDGQGLS